MLRKYARVTACLGCAREYSRLRRQAGTPRGPQLSRGQRAIRAEVDAEKALAELNAWRHSPEALVVLGRAA